MDNNNIYSNIPHKNYVKNLSLRISALSKIPLARTLHRQVVFFIVFVVVVVVVVVLRVFLQSYGKNSRSDPWIKSALNMINIMARLDPPGING